ncbi:hypothetical protein HDV05_002570 [Chytridiales sp. JEL 0842]|nr:hypothetical protein HDV05_002570 [Chytridiales sp. JEL 0842]
MNPADQNGVGDPGYGPTIPDDPLDFNDISGGIKAHLAAGHALEDVLATAVLERNSLRLQNEKLWNIIEKQRLIVQQLQAQLAVKTEAAVSQEVKPPTSTSETAISSARHLDSPVPPTPPAKNDNAGSFFAPPSQPLSETVPEKAGLIIPQRGQSNSPLRTFSEPPTTALSSKDQFRLLPEIPSTSLMSPITLTPVTTTSDSNKRISVRIPDSTVNAYDSYVDSILDGGAGGDSIAELASTLMTAMESIGNNNDENSNVTDTASAGNESNENEEDEISYEPKQSAAGLSRAARRRQAELRKQKEEEELAKANENAAEGPSGTTSAANKNDRVPLPAGPVITARSTSVGIIPLDMQPPSPRPPVPAIPEKYINPSSNGSNSNSQSTDFAPDGPLPIPPRSKSFDGQKPMSPILPYPHEESAQLQDKEGEYMDSVPPLNNGSGYGNQPPTTPRRDSLPRPSSEASNMNSASTSNQQYVSSPTPPLSAMYQQAARSLPGTPLSAAAPVIPPRAMIPANAVPLSNPQSPVSPTSPSQHGPQPSIPFTPPSQIQQAYQTSSPVQQQSLPPTPTPMVPSMMPQLQNLDGIQVAVFSSSAHGPNNISFNIQVQNTITGDSWKLDKTFNDFTALEARLKVSVNRVVLAKIGKAPEKSLLTSLNPGKTDQKKVAIELYLQRIIEVLRDSRDVIEFMTSNAVGFVGTNSSAANQMATSGPSPPSSIYKNRTPSVSKPVDATSPNVGTLNNNLGGSAGSGELADPTQGSTVLKDGYLVKKGKSFGGWKSRYFVCRRGVLEYYEDDQMKELMGAIKFKYCLVSRLAATSSASTADASKYQNGFVLVEYKKGSFVPSTTANAPEPIPAESKVTGKHTLCAESEADRDSWVGTIARQIAECRPGARVGELVNLALNGPSSSAGAPTIPPKESSQGSMGDLPASTVFVDDHARVLQQKPPPLVTPEMQASLGLGGNRMMGSNMGLSGSQGGSSWGLDAAKKTGRMASAFGNWGKKNKGFEEKKPVVQADPSRVIFGAPLEQAVLSSRINDLFDLPAVVYRCIEYLDAMKAYKEEGIYRLSGSSATIQALKDRFNAEGDVDLLGSGEQYDIHAIAGLLKLFLRELPTPVLTRNYQRDFLALTDIQDRSDRIIELSRLVSLLPLPNYTLIRVLIAHLITVVQNSDQNKMSIRNIGIVFSPTLQISAGVFTLMMAEYDDVFCWDDPVRARVAKEKEQEMMQRREREKALAAEQQKKPPAPSASQIPATQDTGGGAGGWDSKDIEPVKDAKKSRRERVGMSMLPPASNTSGSSFGSNQASYLQGHGGDGGYGAFVSQFSNNLSSQGGNSGTDTNFDKNSKRGSMVFMKGSTDELMLQMGKGQGSSNGNSGDHSNRSPRSPRVPNGGRLPASSDSQARPAAGHAATNSSTGKNAGVHHVFDSDIESEGEYVEEVVVDEEEGSDGYSSQDQSTGGKGKKTYRLSEYFGAYSNGNGSTAEGNEGEDGGGGGVYDDEELFG